MAAQRQPLPGRRWHFAHGPIDIVIGADGESDAVHAAHEAAWRRFEPLLDELVAELSLLRAPIDGPNRLRGVVARRMWQACVPFSDAYITPMAAVAGAVAQELVGCYRRAGVRRAWVNNGGDIALYLVDGEQLRVGLFADLAALDAAAVVAAAGGRLALDGRFTVHAADGVRGVATSGWRGRSFSLGIADSVTVLAHDAAAADAAATVIANAVDVDWPGIERAPANTLRDDSDLGDIAVTVRVPPLPAAAVRAALDRGQACAQALRARGQIVAAALVCQHHARLVSGHTVVSPLVAAQVVAP
ncbi:MAG: UPF0280 family protein [Ideonella sp.]|nr:UPF0280 family protein [Ideonella sp.]MCC7457010.1 UPF0280 family protein [Nitrospira sp.]